MQQIYLDLWKLAKPYYEKGRVYDIPHIEWFMKEVERISKIENLDEKLLMPIAVLHDVGYSVAGESNPNIKSQESKKLHMAEGAKIAKEILTQLNYDSDLIEKIVYYISVHDNWVFGDDAPYRECREMAVFNDLDFLWSQSSYEMFEHQSKSIGKKPQDMYDFWMNDEKLVRRPFVCESTRKLFEEFMSDRKQEILKEDETSITHEGRETNFL